MDHATAPPDPGRPEVASDLVEYIVVQIPGTEALASVGAQLVDAVASYAIRILDLVVVTVADDGALDVLDLEALHALDTVRHATTSWGVILSRHDVELVALSLPPGSCAVVLVAEDRWAEPLAMAVRAWGGEVRAGERIARERIEAALTNRPARGEDEGG